MVKNKLLYIFIYVLLIGCGDNVIGNCDSDCHIDMDAPQLTMDNNGYYHMDFLDGSIQTFSTLRVKTNSEYEKVGWLSNKMINLKHYGFDNWTNLVNMDSYTNNNGEAFTVLGVWEEFISDTITVYSAYEDNCGIQYFDSLKVIVESN